MTPDIDLMPSLMLAYVGDAVLEVLVRKHLVLKGYTKPLIVNQMALDFVTAKSQSKACDRLLPRLTQKEEDIYRRGKNAKTSSLPKSATSLEYHKATGLEAVFGYNFLTGNTDRNEKLFEIAYGISQNGEVQSDIGENI